MNNKDKIADMRKVAMFQALSDSELAKLADLATSDQADAGDTIINENSNSKEVFVVLEGRVEIRLANPASTQSELIAELKPGDIIGELTLLGKTRRIATVVAKDPLKYLTWDKDALLNTFKQHSNIGFIMMHEIAKILADRLYSTNMVVRNALANHAAQMNKR